MASYSHTNFNQINYNADYQYYDITIRNHGSEEETLPIQLNYQEQRDTPIINNALDYKMSIIRFSISTFGLPSLIFQIQNRQPDPNLGIYSVTLEYDDGLGGGGQTQPEFLQWIPQNVVPTPIAPSLTSNGLQTFSEYYFCQNYAYFIQILNNALTEAMNKLKLIVSPILDTVEEPFLVWNTDTVSATIYARASHFNSASTAKVNIYFNRALYSLLSTFNFIKFNTGVVRNKYYKLILDRFDGFNIVVLPSFGIDELIFSNQEISTITEWSPISSILFTTSTIPINSTQLSVPSVYIDGQQNSLTPSFKNFSNIITDLSSDEFSYKSNLLYLPSAQYRYVSLQNNSPLTNIDISVFWKDKLGIIREFLLLPGGSAEIKILFEKINKS
jgi:hypothetical protein